MSMHFKGIWDLFYGDVGRGEGFIIPALFVQDVAKYKVGTPCLRIERDDVAIEGFLIPIDACLPPSQHPQYNQNHRHNDQCALFPPVRQATHAIRGRADDDAHDPNPARY